MSKCGSGVVFCRNIGAFVVCVQILLDRIKNCVVCEGLAIPCRNERWWKKKVHVPVAECDDTECPESGRFYVKCRME